MLFSRRQIIHDTMLELDCTVISICHRTTYASRFDLIMVLDKGQVVELGPPATLQQDPASFFSSFLRSARTEGAQ